MKQNTEYQNTAAAPAAQLAPAPELPKLRGIFPFDPPPCAAPSLAESPDIRSWPDENLSIRGIWLMYRIERIGDRLSSLEFNRDKRAAANATSRSTDPEEIAAGIAIVRTYNEEIAKYTAIRSEFVKEHQAIREESNRRTDARSGGAGIIIREAR